MCVETVASLCLLPRFYYKARRLNRRTLYSAIFGPPLDRRIYFLNKEGPPDLSVDKSITLLPVDEISLSLFSYLGKIKSPPGGLVASTARGQAQGSLVVKPI